MSAIERVAEHLGVAAETLEVGSFPSKTVGRWLSDGHANRVSVESGDMGLAIDTAVPLTERPGSGTYLYVVGSIRRGEERASFVEQLRGAEHAFLCPVANNVRDALEQALLETLQSSTAAQSHQVADALSPVFRDALRPSPPEQNWATYLQAHLLQPLHGEPGTTKVSEEERTFYVLFNTEFAGRRYELSVTDLHMITAGPELGALKPDFMLVVSDDQGLVDILMAQVYFGAFFLEDLYKTDTSRVEPGWYAELGQQWLSEQIKRLEAALRDGNRPFPHAFIDTSLLDAALVSLEEKTKPHLM